MEVTITAIIEVLNGVEKNLKEALRESGAMSGGLFSREDRIRLALTKVQEANIHLIQVR